ncbi:homeobox protein ceh-36-like, partial [Patella vulgata]|uniref:homeobox protein ceh-36-like n=1 Tax=Patella vulgata TaxID=6465 RepID=UPI00217F3F30
DDDEEIDDEYRPFTPPPPRERLSYTRYQLELLSGIYEKVRYPNSTQKLLIAKRVGITREQVKIWFQNRRRKDVINNPKRKGNSSTESSGSPTSAESEPSTPPQTEDSKPNSPADIDGPKMVPNVVLKSVIDELERFEKTVLKAKKSKKKSRPKQQQQTQQKMSTTAIKANAASLFTAYDMVSPPNKVISPAMLNTSINRFSHSKTTSAFQDPKMFENIPVLADLLGYRSSDSIRSQKQHLNHSLSPHNSYVVSPNRGATDRGYADIPGSVNHGSLGVNRVFPFPFIADAPVMLSSMRHPDPYRPPA